MGDVDRLSDSVTAVMDNEVRTLVTNVDKDVGELTSSVDGLVKHLDESLATKFDPALADIAKASESLPELMQEVRLTLRRTG